MFSNLLALAAQARVGEWLMKSMQLMLLNK